MERPNLDYIQQLANGDTNFERKLIAVLKKEFPEEKAVYEENIRIKNFTLASENVHKIKHKISILGLEKSYELATNYENNLREANHSLKEEFDSIMHNIAEYLLKL